MENKITEILKDQVQLDHYKRYNYAVACEDCTHFDHETQTCTFQFPVDPFLRKNQQIDLETKGVMAFCRSMEID